MTGFPDAARNALADAQLRRNLAHATSTIRARRADAVAQLCDWEQLREAGRAIKEQTLLRLDEHLVALEAAVVQRGGVVHWARDAAEATAMIGDIVVAHGATNVVKAKSLTTEELALNEALEARGIHAWETDLAQLVVQLAGDAPSHILVPAIHRNRTEIRDLFLRTLPDAPRDLGDDPRELVAVARRHLRKLFLETRVGISGVNFAIAETGTLCIVESEGNARTGGHAYGATYPGPIGAILTPMLTGAHASLPYASSLCGACYEVCPVKIDIPKVLVHLRGRQDHGRAERVLMRAIARTFSSRRGYESAQRLARAGQWPWARKGTIERLPGAMRAWTRSRDLRPIPKQSFRDWWASRP